MMLTEILYSTITNKCPRCHTGKVFTNNNPYSISNGLTMERKCSYCGEIFEKEPGYFYGAMYVSYALMSGWFMIWYALNSFWIHAGIAWFLTLISLSIVSFSPLTFRWSRSIWINFFVRFDKTKRSRKSSDAMEPDKIA